MIRFFLLAHASRHCQSGTVLIIALVFLLLMTLVGVAAMQGTTLQERMAGNHRDRNLAFQAAEAALREGELEAWSNGEEIRKTFEQGNGTTGLEAGRLANPADWDGDSPAPTVPELALDPQQLPRGPSAHVGNPWPVFIAPEDPEGGVFNLFPITSYAEGGTARAIVILQTSLALP